MKIKSLLTITVLSFTLAFLSGCGGSLSGTYEAQSNAFFDKLNFISSDKVEVTGYGNTKEATYRKEGNKVVISASGENQVFTLDEKGCLNGGPQIGVYCKK